MDWIRGRPKAAAALGVGAVILVLALVALLVNSGETPATRAIEDLSDQPSSTFGPAFGLPTATPTPTPTPTPGGATGSGASGSGSGGGLSGLPAVSDADQFDKIDIPGIPGGSAFRFAEKHRVMLRVTSQGPIGTIGYYIPYSPDKQSGTVKNVGRSWSLSTVSYGEPDYARIYLSSGANAAITVTCTITIDGRVVEQRTTDGPYSVMICQG